MKTGESKIRLMGFGHRVYKNFDPRATLLKKTCDRVFGELGINDPLLDLAKKIEEHALKDEYFVKRKLYPNVDFYSGIIYRAMGIPTEMFTVMFTLGRLPGWIAHWMEQRQRPGRSHPPPAPDLHGRDGARLRGPGVRASSERSPARTTRGQRESVGLARFARSTRGNWRLWCSVR